jgi:hypothetical protein
LRRALAFALLLLPGALFAEDREPFLSGEVSLGAASAAVYRGERLTRDPTLLAVPSLSLTIGGLVTLWGEGTWDTHTETITRKRGNHLLIEEKRYAEKSVGVSIEKDTEVATLSLDASVTQLSEGAGTPRAGSLSIVLHAPLSPALEVTRDIGGPGNWYLEPGLKPKVVFSDALRAELEATAGYYAHATLQSRFFGGETTDATKYSGFSDAKVSAALVYEPGAFRVQAKALYARFLSEDVRLRVGQVGQPKGTLLGSLTVVWGF